MEKKCDNQKRQRNLLALKNEETIKGDDKKKSKNDICYFSWEVAFISLQNLRWTQMCPLLKFFY